MQDGRGTVKIDGAHREATDVSVSVGLCASARERERERESVCVMGNLEKGEIQLIQVGLLLRWGRSLRYKITHSL